MAHFNFQELAQDGLTVLHQMSEIHFQGSSEWQDVSIVTTHAWGRMLILDDKVQSSEKDEFVYHESLVHPAMLAHSCPKRVFIAGGGEGATAREVLRHKTVEKLVMVDIDGVAVDVCKKHLPKHHAGSFDHPKTELVIDDAKAYLENTSDEFDVIILDLADPLPDGPCYLLYSVEFYQMMIKKLAPGGIVVTQSGPAGLVTCTDVCLPIYNTLSTVFTHTALYTSHVPSFLDMYGFTIASLTVDIGSRLEGKIDELIEERIEGGSTQLKFYDETTWTVMSRHPKWMRTLMKTFKEVITDAAPRYIPSVQA